MLASPALRTSKEFKRWELVPDSRGHMHLVDLNALDLPVEPLYVPATDVIFLLFTRRNPTVGQRIQMNVASIQNSQFIASHPTRFLIHGWTGDLDDEINHSVRSAFLRFGEYNVSQLI